MATIEKLPYGSWQVHVRRKGEAPISKSFLGKSSAEQGKVQSPRNAVNTGQ